MGAGCIAPAKPALAEAHDLEVDYFGHGNKGFAQDMICF
jgi:uncharacterized caspase-like protein